MALTMSLNQFLKQRNIKKTAKHLLHEANHVRHMREDITSPKLIDQLNSRRDELRAALKAKNWTGAEALFESLSEIIHKIYPPPPSPRLKENLEVIVVALTVAMAFRTYFIQPFKIPTGSMQPTLYGITFHKPSSFKPFNHYPLRLINFALFAEYPVRIRAIADGPVYYRGKGQDAQMVLGVDRSGKKLKTKTLDTRFLSRHFTIGNTGVQIPIPLAFECYVKNGDFVRKGDLLAAGTVRGGDHIFVNKVAYNFVRPKRGNIIVFDTEKIDYPNIKTNTFYIKRLVGLPSETIEINAPDDINNIEERFLIIDGKKITEPYPFERMITRADEGYTGHVLTGLGAARRPKLALPGDKLVLSDTQYLPFGDNTRFSLDGRYFGGIEREFLIGPAFAVYWPLSKRWGLVK